MEGNAPPKKDGVCSVQWSPNTGILVAVRSALSPEPQTLVSPCDFSLLYPLVSGCEQDFVSWPLKRAPVFPADFHLSLADRIPADFHSQML